MTLEVLLGLAPILVVFLPLLVGRYLGAERLERIAARRRERLRRPRPARFITPRSAPVELPHGGLLLARRLSGRAPPLTA